MDDEHEGNFCVGLIWGIVLSLPTWLAVAWAFYIVFFYHRHGG